MFKILVVEDDKDLNRTVCSFLNQNGYEATGCLNGDDAYDAMYSTMFDLIISDIMMPGVDGFEFAKNVRELNEVIPILFMTARDDIASKQRGFSIGVDDYMVKADAELLSLVWNNLFSNAFKFTEAGAGISITVIAMSLYMIIRSSQELKNNKEISNGK